MALTTETYGNWTAYVGTRAEVLAALRDHPARVENTQIYYNGTNITAVVYGG
jgi:hypothetical protein